MSTVLVIYVLFGAYNQAHSLHMYLLMRYNQLQSQLAVHCGTLVQYTNYSSVQAVPCYLPHFVFVMFLSENVPGVYLHVYK